MNDCPFIVTLTVYFGVNFVFLESFVLLSTLSFCSFVKCENVFSSAFNKLSNFNLSCSPKLFKLSPSFNVNATPLIVTVIVYFGVNSISSFITLSIVTSFPFASTSFTKFFPDTFFNSSIFAFSSFFNSLNFFPSSNLKDKSVFLTVTVTLNLALIVVFL